MTLKFLFNLIFCTLLWELCILNDSLAEETTLNINTNYGLRENRAVKRMQHLVSCNGSKFYLNTTTDTHYNARKNCEAFGMKLARFSSQAQQTCVWNAVRATVVDDTNIWTDGQNKWGYAAFNYCDFNCMKPVAVPSYVLVGDWANVYLALTMSRGNSNLMPYWANAQGKLLCMI